MSNSNEKSRQGKPEGGDVKDPETGKAIKWQIVPEDKDRTTEAIDRDEERVRRAKHKEKVLAKGVLKTLFLYGIFVGIIFIIFGAILNSSACTEKDVDFRDWADNTALAGAVGFIIGVLRGVFAKETYNYFGRMD
jgi:hypothetical protein